MLQKIAGSKHLLAAADQLGRLEELSFHHFKTSKFPSISFALAR